MKHDTCFCSVQLPVRNASNEATHFMRGSLRIGKRVYPTVSQRAGTKNGHADMVCAVGLLQDPSLRPLRKEKKRLTTNQPNTGSTDIEDGEGPHVPGEFDEDEPEEVLGKVKASKSSACRDRASAGSGSGYRTATPAISQSGGGPVVALRV
jgi:hypothetical protein